MDALDGLGCDWVLNELGPPPDAILRIPPPPMPSFIDWDGWMKDMAPINHDHQDNDTLPCHWCHLTRRFDVPPPAASDAEMAMEETWFFVILASSLMLLLGVLLSGLVYWTLNRKTMKGTWDFGSFFSESGTVLMGGCSSPTSQGNDLLKQNDQADNGGVQMATPQQASVPAPTRALWAGVKTLSEGNHYTITHAQPFEQRVQRNRFAPADEDSAGYTTLQPTRLDYPTDNQIYYCCTDLMLMSPPRSGNVFKVTSLDDTVDPVPNSLYVNMSPVHPYRTLNQQTPCNATCCPLRAPCHPLSSLPINRSAVSPVSPHLHPGLGENWRKV